MLIISNTINNKGRYTAQIETFSGNYSPISILVTDNQQTISGDLTQPVTIEAEDITSVSANGIKYTPVANPETPQFGEYLWNPYSKQLQIFADDLPRSIQVASPPSTITVIPPLLFPPYPELFQNLPLEGAIQLNRNFEEHPSATAEFEIALPKSTIQQILSPGLEVDIYGIPLRIENLSITELPRAIYPDMRCRVTINFGGKWENYIEDPVFLRDDGSNNLIWEDDPNPSCSTTVTEYNTSSSDREASIPRLLAQAGISYNGSDLKPIDIPIGTPADETIDLLDSLDSQRLRIANSFIKWSHQTGVVVIPLEGGKAWDYKDTEILGEISTNYDAIDKLSKKKIADFPNLNPPQSGLVDFPSAITLPPTPEIRNEPQTNLAFEYPNIELIGEFLQFNNSSSETTQGNSPPRWVRKKSKQEMRIEGDADAHLFPEGTVSIQVISMCFDLGGVTKSRQFVTLEDGAEIRIISEVWGFVFTADDIYDDSRNRIIGNPLEYWKLIKKTTTDLSYDEQTGYLLYETERGFNTVRFRKENTETPETLDLPDGDTDKALYQFFQIPTFKRTSRYLEKFAEYSIEDAVDWVQMCDRNNKPFLAPVYNPNFSPPYYTKRERTESAGFASIENPELESAEGKKNPDLVVGEESLFESRTTIVPAEYREVYTERNGATVRLKREELSPAKYYTYEKKYKAQGEGMAEALQEASVAEGIGEPPVAKRRPSQYVREEKIPYNEPNDSEDVGYRYFLQTPGYSYKDPIGGSENFAIAETLEEALTGARAKFIVENWRNGYQETLQIPGNLNIQEGDKFNYLCNGEKRKRVVISVSHSLEILGIVGTERKITAITSLTLGRNDNFPELNYTRHKPLEGSATLIWDKNLGRILTLEGNHRRSR